METHCYLVREEHIPERAAFPVVDAHNHLWGSWSQLNAWIQVLDEVGVAAYCDLTANVHVSWVEGGYELGTGSMQEFLSRCADRFPGRFYGFTIATFARPTKEPLFVDSDHFVAETVALLRQHVSLGARGLKILKELGLRYRDANGSLIAIDDLRLAPIWEEAADLHIPVLIHQADPYGFFQPATPQNEHFDTLSKYPSWDFSDPCFPRHHELLQRRDILLRRHRRTTFILPHVASFPEHLDYVARLLDENPNVYIDFSARLDELGRQPYRAREFMIRHQERILFGSDMPPSAAMYRCYFRFLETYDEWFHPPDYDGTFDRHRWGICGLGLPPQVLRKIYYENALRIIPGLTQLTHLDLWTHEERKT